jgi:hypothetical protein
MIAGKLQRAGNGLIEQLTELDNQCLDMACVVGASDNTCGELVDTVVKRPCSKETGHAGDHEYIEVWLA